eukprot:snap_masked-scaffold_5-processed-gene-8.57-mRNA-1 protein AED:1.00 eAED:1.00 QI:0/-1/0/0/-1/1/1/0/92
MQEHYKKVKIIEKTLKFYTTNQISNRTPKRASFCGRLYNSELVQVLRPLNNRYFEIAKLTHEKTLVLFTPSGEYNTFEWPSSPRNLCKVKLI